MAQSLTTPLTTAIAASTLLLLSGSAFSTPPQLQVHIEGPGGVNVVILPEENSAAPPLRADVDLPVVSAGFADDQALVGPLTRFIDALRSSEYQKREEATRSLLRLPPDRLSDIIDALAHESDSEAIARLSEVAAHLYLKARTPLQRPSFLGVWFKDSIVPLMGMHFSSESIRIHPEDQNLSRTVVVSGLEVGFPAYQVLRPGDRIIALNGKSFDTEATILDFRTQVQAFWPGTLIHLTVMRDEKTLELTVQIAGLATSDPSNVQAALDERNQALAMFLKTLKTADRNQPLIMKPAPNLGLLSPKLDVRLIGQPKGDENNPAKVEFIEDGIRGLPFPLDSVHGK